MSSLTDDLRLWTQLRMRQRNLSHAQLALKSGLDRSTITRFLAGARRPTLEVAIRIVDSLYDATCPAPIEQLRGLLAGPERVEAALRSDPLLHRQHVDDLMRRYRERRSSDDRADPARDNRHRWVGKALTLPGSASMSVSRPTNTSNGEFQ